MNVAEPLNSSRHHRPNFDWRMLVAMHLRRTPFGAVIGAALIGGAAVLLRAMYVDASEDVLQFARLSAVIIAAASAAALENSCSAITSTTSLRRSVSAWLSAGLTGGGAMVVWLVPVLVARRIAGDPGGLPVGGLMIEMVALLVVGWLLTEVISRVRGMSGAGTLAGASLTLAVIMSLMTSYTIEWLWRGPDPDWQVIHVRWAMIAAIATSCLAVGLRDSAAPWPSLRTTLRPSLHKIHPGNSVEESDEF